MWLKFRHKIVFALLTPILRVFLRVKYHFHSKNYELIKGPYLILYNHQTNLDPIMVSMSFKGPIYYMANDDLFNIPYISKIIRYLVAPIPKAKSVRDIQAIKDCIRITKAGGRIAIAPEGNRSYSGRLENIDKAIVKLAKLLNAPVILYNIKGGYGTNPRFSTTIRKGKMYGEVIREISTDELKLYTDEELYRIIIKELDFDDLTLKEKYKGKALAESLESVFYVCPVCGGISTLVSDKNHLNCTKCGLMVEYTEELRFKTEDIKFNFDTVNEFYKYQKEYIQNINIDKLKHFDNDVKLRKIIKFKKREYIMTGKITLNSNGIIISNDETTKIFNLDEIISLAIVYHNTLIINLENDKFQIVANERFNALKYLHLFYKIKNEKQGVKDGFLGI